ncbi:MAG: MarR family winged helix-turn-helix transcriptional regulator, partial [Nocardioides sp.]
GRFRVHREPAYHSSAHAQAGVNRMSGMSDRPLPSSEACVPVEPRWLSEEERQTWIGLVAVMTVLPSAVEGPLRREHGLSLYEYYVLAMLSEADNRTLPLKPLAQLTNGSLSRLSHVLDRLEGRDLLVRRPSATDGRVTLAEITDQGYALLLSAAPSHVAVVRQLVFDNLDGDQVTQLGSVLETMLATLGIRPPMRQADPSETAVPEAVRREAAS